MVAGVLGFVNDESQTNQQKKKLTNNSKMKLMDIKKRFLHSELNLKLKKVVTINCLMILKIKLIV